MDRLIKLCVGGVALIVFAYVNAAVSDSVSRYQLNTFYACYVDFTEAEFVARCRNERDGFGHMRVMPE